jgi:hypothetical protein
MSRPVERCSPTRGNPKDFKGYECLDGTSPLPDTSHQNGYGDFDFPGPHGSSTQRISTG